MSLKSIWFNSPHDIEGRTIQQLVGLVGKLLDGSSASGELRDFLASIPAENLSRYANECLTGDKFTEGGAALQDVVNEVGRRIGFKVEAGLYRGKVNEVGFDGIWRSHDEAAIIVEVKTTDTYSIELETLAGYKKRLVASGKVDESRSSILVIVGRADTGSWEAQIRGSRYAWDIRLISVEALIRLMDVRQGVEDPKVVERIRAILTPKEFTKVDEIVDLVFSTAEDVKSEEILLVEPAELTGKAKPKFTPVDFRVACLQRIQASLKIQLIKRSAALYTSADDKIAVFCLNSRRHEHPTAPRYWFAFHPHQRDELKTHTSSYVAFGCGSEKTVILIPAQELLAWLDQLWITEDATRMYWHVRILEKGGKFVIQTKAGYKPIDVTKYVVPNKL
jgi:hypothetical protein